MNIFQRFAQEMIKLFPRLQEIYRLGLVMIGKFKRNDSRCLDLEEVKTNKELALELQTELKIPMWYAQSDEHKKAFFADGSKSLLECYGRVLITRSEIIQAPMLFIKSYDPYTDRDVPEYLYMLNLETEQPSCFAKCQIKLSDGLLNKIKSIWNRNV